MAAALPPAAHRLDDEARLAVLLEAIEFSPYPEVPEALRALRGAGLRLVVVSNWDVSLHQALRATGVDRLVDGALSSAEAGAAKPARAIFDRAVALAGTEPRETVHVGDSVAADVQGALAAGSARCSSPAPASPIRGRVPDGVPVVRDLAPRWPPRTLDDAHDAARIASRSRIPSCPTGSSRRLRRPRRPATAGFRRGRRGRRSSPSSARSWPRWSSACCSSSGSRRRAPTSTRATRRRASRSARRSPRASASSASPCCSPA
jgi:HAD superfamily hydrolase (TIGR01549 family)